LEGATTQKMGVKEEEKRLVKVAAMEGGLKGNSEDKP
jgi:hypothetical protein